MAIFFNFHIPKPKQFHYKPRYYDERKERLAQMEAAAKESKKDGQSFSRLHRGFLSDQRSKSRLKRATFEKESLLRFLIILVVVMTVFYFIFPEIFKEVFSLTKGAE